MTFQFPELDTIAQYHGKAMTTKELASEYGMNNRMLRGKIKQCMDIGKRHLLFPNEISTVIRFLGDFRNDPFTVSNISSRKK